MQILLGTKNKHKILEMTRIIKKYNSNIIIKSLNDYDEVLEPIENGKSFEENAFIKAKYYYELFKIPTVADDSGLEVEALNNEPGLFSARYASCNNHNAQDSKNRQKLLLKMANITNRKAHFVCATCYYDGLKKVVTNGITEGKILLAEIGHNGFGYDAIFFSDELNKPLALATNFEKDSISHRGKALTKLLKCIL